MTEREEKYLAFKNNDLSNNHGLIINQLKEVNAIMNHPQLTEGFRLGYLNNLLSYATENSEFYKPYNNYKSLADFPIVDKEILKQNYDKVFVQKFKNRPDNKEKRTSGSTGTPFTVYWDHRKHCRMIADVKYFASKGGCESHERIVCMIVSEKDGHTSMEKQERDNVYNVYCSYFDDISIEKMLKEIESYNPKSIIAYSSMWDAIANYIYEGKAGECKLNLFSILSEAEGLKERTREILSEYFHCPVYSRYGNEENGVLAQEDGSEYGHLLNIASYHVELLAMDSDEPVKDGEIGRVVITDLFNYAFPMIRYSNGDLAVKHVTEDGKVYLQDVVGRKVDMLYTTDGRMVNWLRSLIFLKRYKDIKQFQIIQETETEYTWVLNTTNHNYEELIVRESKELFGEDSKYTFRYVNEIPKLKSGKTQMTICKLKK